MDMDKRLSYQQYFEEQLCVDALYHDNPYDRESITEILELILDIQFVLRERRYGLQVMTSH